MRCDEIQEHFIDLLYDEGVDSPASLEVREHIRTCSVCRKELEELRQTRKYLQLWKDEHPRQSVAIAKPAVARKHSPGWQYLRYAAIAAMLIITFMALANTQISWNKNGFTFSSHLFPQQKSQRDYYTKAELRNILKQALDDSEFRMSETNYSMMQKMLDTIEQDRYTYTSHYQNRN
jgi:hypothetical protein